eukprot:CAMPEP_0194309682 /NCGR_PEP_ID=MMETSP0171-20130528/6653_1 /TAXON_ID=218684 /ORGANISM="Corethron pennatum, Strain L29A3" /LENGTH=361 /DNA_ID=CAMNT_0039062967 /DNA_START=242 /DNA_END=1324 /DNA_ORIENTATION=+
MAVLLSADNKICGGSLIAPNLVLSAAHCGESFKEVRVGVTNRKEPDDLAETVNIEEVVVHPDYGGKAGDLENDFMILVLSKNIEKIMPVCLAEADDYLPTSNSLWIMGWGHTESNDDYSDVLLETDVFYVPNENCRGIKMPNGIAPLQTTIDSENYMCAAHRQEKNSCFGDGGGPLIIKGDASSNDVQVGITSFGFQCEAPVGVYARISAQRDWIDGVVRTKRGSLRQNCPRGQSRPPTPPTKIPTEDPTTYPSEDPTTYPSEDPMPKRMDGVTSRPTDQASMVARPSSYLLRSFIPTHSSVGVPTVASECEIRDVGIMISGEIIDCRKLASTGRLNCLITGDAAACPIACSCPDKHTRHW